MASSARFLHVISVSVTSTLESPAAVSGNAIVNITSRRSPPSVRSTVSDSSLRRPSQSASSSSTNTLSVSGRKMRSSDAISSDFSRAPKRRSVAGFTSTILTRPIAERTNSGCAAR
jgi:hypothetical protein